MFYRQLIVTVLVITISVGAAFCQEKPAGKPVNESRGNIDKTLPEPCDVIISIGDKKLTFQQIQWFDPEPGPEQIIQIANHWLETELLYTEALKRNLANEPKVKYLSEFSAKQTVSRELVNNVRKAAEPTDKDILNYYEKNKNTGNPLIMEPEYFAFSHIRTKTLKQAQTILERIKKGEDINELAKELSTHRDAKRGGKAQKWRASTVRSRLGTNFYNALEDASEGDLIGPIKANDGNYEIARHEGKIKSKTRAFEKVKNKIKTQLSNKRQQKAYKDLLDSIKEKAGEIKKSKWMIEEKG